MGDWLYPMLSGLLCGASYLFGLWRGSRVKKLDCDDFEAVKKVYEHDELTPLLKLPNGDLYRPTRCIMVIDGGKTGRYAAIGSEEGKSRDLYNNVAAVVEIAATNGVSKEDAVYTMALAVDVIYNRQMEDKQHG